MLDPYSSAYFVDVLPTVTTRAVCFKLNIFWSYVKIDIPKFGKDANYSS